jgi:uncharacterized protein YjbI with pentapeptide repeats
LLLPPSPMIALFVEVANRIGWIPLLIGVAATILTGIIAWQKHRLSRRKHLADELKSALRDLGDPDLRVRRAAVRALERLALEEPDEVDAALDGLQGLVAERAPLKRGFWLLKKVPDDAAAALNAIQKIRAKHPHSRERPIVLPETYLVGLSCRRANFDGADFTAAEFGDAHAPVVPASLRETSFRGANLRRCIFAWADLDKASFVRADLEGAQLHGATLNGADFSEANLRRADFTDAHVADAVFAGADLRGANLRLVRGLRAQQLDEAKVDQTTELPEPWERPSLVTRLMSRTARMRRASVARLRRRERSL